MYLQFGCGLSAPEGWENFDASPTLRLQRIPVLGRFAPGVRFPAAVRYGNIVKGLPVAEASCDGVYASHVLEHLALNDFKRALANTLRILKSGGVFRCIVPDLAGRAEQYLNAFRDGQENASHAFMKDCHLGCTDRPSGVKGLIVAAMGNADHQWMWDTVSLPAALQEAGFDNIRRCAIGDSGVDMFEAVESPTRFHNERLDLAECAFEARRP